MNTTSNLIPVSGPRRGYIAGMLVDDPGAPAAPVADDDYDDYVGCECEIDWNCPLHAGRVGTWIETRYSGWDMDDDYARYTTSGGPGHYRTAS